MHHFRERLYHPADVTVVRCPESGEVRGYLGARSPYRSSASATTPGHLEQPPPVRNDGPSIQSLVRDDLDAWPALGDTRHQVASDIGGREQVGIERYGTTLQAFNGRDALRDAYEELLDGATYARQAMAEASTRGWNHDALAVLYHELLVLACELWKLRESVRILRT